MLAPQPEWEKPLDVSEQWCECLTNMFYVDHEYYLNVRGLPKKWSKVSAVRKLDIIQPSKQFKPNHEWWRLQTVFSIMAFFISENYFNITYIHFDTNSYQTYCNILSPATATSFCNAHVLIMKRSRWIFTVSIFKFGDSVSPKCPLKDKLFFLTSMKRII
jgi:hypothetical protein